MIVFDDRINPRLISEQEIQEFEVEFNISLPRRYKNILKDHNGSVPEPSDFHIYHDGEKEEYGIGEFIELHTKDGEFGSVYDFAEILHNDNGISRKIIPFGVDGGGNLMCFDYRESEYEPKIVFWKHDEDRGLDFVSESFDKFLDNLY